MMRNDPITKIAALSVATAALVAAAPLATMAQDLESAAIEAGEVEYLSACAGCHGKDGKGDGPMADLLRIETPDLTKMTERAGGTFPFRNTLLLIDGREVRAHGGEMPVWGERYSIMAAREEGAVRPPRVPGDPELIVKGRLLALVTYLESIQE